MNLSLFVKEYVVALLNKYDVDKYAQVDQEMLQVF